LSNDRNKNSSRCKTNRWKTNAGHKVTPAIAYYRNVEAYKDVSHQIDFHMQILLKSYLILLELQKVIRKTSWYKNCNFRY
jgi:hypothetical protein